MYYCVSIRCVADICCYHCPKEEKKCEKACSIVHNLNWSACMECPDSDTCMTICDKLDKDKQVVNCESCRHL